MRYNNSDTSGHESSAKQIREIERIFRQKPANEDFSVPPDVFNLMTALVDLGEPATRVFHWLRGVTKIVEQSNGGVVLHCNRLTADYLFQFLRDPLKAHFNTGHIAAAWITRSGILKINYLSVDRSVDGLSPAGQRVVAQAKAQLGIGGGRHAAA